LIHTLPYTLASYSPFDRICVDTIGPLPVDTETENEYILVIIDAFSRFVKLYPIPDTTAKSALLSLMDWVGMFGIPSEMVSDNGTQFANDLISEFLSTLETTDAKIQAYSKEENGLVERANKEVNRHLRTIVYNRKVKNKWVKYLPLVQRIMNASIHSSIGVSPAQIVFGNSVRLDRNLLPLETQVHATKANEYLADLLSGQRDILQIAIRNQDEIDQFHIAERGGNPITEFPVNSYVLVNYEGEGHRPPSKLHTFLRGPLRIVNCNKQIYTLENLVTNKLEDFHVKLLHPFKFDTALVDPQEVAQHDEDYFGIVDVLDHRFVNAKERKTDLEFLVLFEGDQVPVWQPWSADIRNNEKVHAYLEQNNMRRFIPVKYTFPRDHPLYVKPVRNQGASVPHTRKPRRRFGKY
jgi:Integrase core domain